MKLTYVLIGVSVAFAFIATGISRYLKWKDAKARPPLFSFPEDEAKDQRKDGEWYLRLPADSLVPLMPLQEDWPSYTPKEEGVFLPLNGEYGLPVALNLTPENTMNEPTHPTHGTLDQTLAAVKERIAQGEMPADLHAALPWFVHQYGLAVRSAERG